MIDGMQADVDEVQLFGEKQRPSDARGALPYLAPKDAGMEGVIVHGPDRPVEIHCHWPDPIAYVRNRR